MSSKIIIGAKSETIEVESYTVEFLSLKEGAALPKKGTSESAGFDLVASENMVLAPFEIGTIPLGFATSMPHDIHCRIESRSGMALKGAVVLTGVIDADYRGEWKVIMRNFNKEPLVIAQGDRVAQAVFRATPPVTFTTVSELSESSRGAGGFGSTGR